MKRREIKDRKKVDVGSRKFVVLFRLHSIRNSFLGMYSSRFHSSSRGSHRRRKDVCCTMSGLRGISMLLVYTALERAHCVFGERLPCARPHGRKANRKKDE